MLKFVVEGGRTIGGEYRVKGAKNSILPLLAATVSIPGDHCFTNCPNITDVDNMIRILEALGVKVVKYRDGIFINSDNLLGCSVPEHLMKEIRSSVFLTGALLGRLGEAVVSRPGGCDIGERPTDIHYNGLRQLGAAIEEKEQMILCKGEELRGCNIRLTFPSVGATENIILAAIGAEGITVIENAAREPEIIDLQNYINSCGGKIRGAGTGKITIRGKDHVTLRSKGLPFEVMGDRIEAATYLVAATGTGGNIFISGVKTKYLKPVLKQLKKVGAKIHKGKDWLYLKAPRKIKGGLYIKTEPYPGFPTDCQQLFMSLLSFGNRESVIEESIFEKRFSLANTINYMGGNVEINGKNAIIKPTELISGKRVEATDLRGGAALVISGLMAEGCTIIEGAEHIMRGYDGLVKELNKLGGKVDEEKQSDEKKE